MMQRTVCDTIPLITLSIFPIIKKLLEITQMIKEATIRMLIFVQRRDEGLYLQPEYVVLFNVTKVTV
ncbi:hypothetical protein KIN20_015792 [Parelaphostrongylus tenuis]|uniref:Uncharacterized protein n=1 Tax=Parelaphostrongylus tenuis TaxID=148309 RepID=A0AAD5QSP8_PARTN|nr:hypothetical protein KIN20_015792 [Parelaphostrongylus tenuis]